jgi:hypothetical protein
MGVCVCCWWVKAEKCGVRPKWVHSYTKLGVTIFCGATCLFSSGLHASLRSLKQPASPQRAYERNIFHVGYGNHCFLLAVNPAQHDYTASLTKPAKSFSMEPRGQGHSEARNTHRPTLFYLELCVPLLPLLAHSGSFPALIRPRRVLKFTQTIHT